jgi:hypothetical protein
MAMFSFRRCPHDCHSHEISDRGRQLNGCPIYLDTELDTHLERYTGPCHCLARDISHQDWCTWGPHLNEWYARQDIGLAVPAQYRTIDSTEVLKAQLEAFLAHMRVTIERSIATYPTEDVVAEADTKNTDNEPVTDIHAEDGGIEVQSGSAGYHEDEMADVVQEGVHASTVEGEWEGSDWDCEAGPASQTTKRRNRTEAPAAEPDNASFRSMVSEMISKSTKEAHAMEEMMRYIDLDACMASSDDGFNLDDHISTGNTLPAFP